MPQITPFLWFENQAEEAAQFYTSIFPNSRILDVARYGDAGAKASGRAKGSVMTVSFELDGQRFVALNGGPEFQFTPAISFVVNCDTQADIDAFWEKLSAGGKPQQCGWLQDKYGVSWQIVPSMLGDLFQSGDAGTSEQVMAALVKMTRLDLKELKAAAGK